MSDEWVETTLGQTANFVNGYPFKPKDLSGSSLPVIRIKQLLDPNAETDFTDLEVPPRYLICDGDLIFSWSGTLASRIWTRGPAALNQHLFLVEEKSGVSRGWLHLALDHAVEELMTKTHGTTMKHVTKGVLEAHSVLLPPLPVQRRIVDLMAHLDNHLANLRAERDAVDRVLTALRREVWDRHLGRVHTLDEVLTGITAGRSPDTTGERPTEEQPGVLKVNAIDPTGRFLSDEAKVLPPNYSMNPDWEVREGDLLVTRANTAERVAAVAMVPQGVRRNLFLCDKTLRLELRKDAVDASYLAEVLLAPQARIQVAEMATGVGSSMVNISQVKLRNWKVPVPTLDVQRHEASTLGALRSLGLSLASEERRLRDLRSIALASALSGGVDIPFQYDHFFGEAM